jgi:hypothetical protein
VTKLIRFPIAIGLKVAETARREHRTYTGQVLHWLKKGMAADGVVVEDQPDADLPPAS